MPFSPFALIAIILLAGFIVWIIRKAARVCQQIGQACDAIESINNEDQQ